MYGRGDVVVDVSQILGSLDVPGVGCVLASGKRINPLFATLVVVSTDPSVVSFVNVHGILQSGRYNTHHTHTQRTQVLRHSFVLQQQ